MLLFGIFLENSSILPPYYMPIISKRAADGNLATSANFAEPRLPAQQTEVPQTATSNELFGTAAFLANPVYAGGATWLGALLSIAAAWVAFKQAKAAISAVARVQREQQRKYVESAQRAITSLNQAARPIISCSPSDRGIKFPSIMAGVNDICHDLLSSPIDKVLPALPASIKNIERDFTKIADAFEAAKADPLKLEAFRNLQQSIKGEIQFLSRTCADYFDQAATKSD